ncbi:SDR family oxidoreductase [Aestuariicella sp. G3-2]|uniref:SDR family NAD(P)-dependent oxidoreductase n=1 Tax=Pseudomaricurvus albidus TaxID=2842452 RepID=UPI001C0B97A2|nr:SDR family oxidoreductase [Aestuariicella albida]MBU3070002.1 SDR family oxidoreductase [Aestuariicella albida]
MSNTQFTLTNRTALITGASSGIGATLAKGLSTAGATVVLAARRAERIEQLVDEIESEGGKAVAVNMDVTQRESVKSAFDLAERFVGKIDTVVNNAGVAAPKNFARINDEERDFVMNTNFNGVWNVAQEAAQRMIQAGKSGSIVNIASVLGLTAKPGQTSYCASKGAVIQLTRAMALDLIKYNIRVNAIAPGWFKTEMNEDFFNSAAGQKHIEQMPARRLGDIQELVGPVIMLCSDAGSFVNGAVLPVDGAISVAGI